jgi:hypothetical protein
MQHTKKVLNSLMFIPLSTSLADAFKGGSFSSSYKFDIGGIQHFHFILYFNLIYIGINREHSIGMEIGWDKRPVFPSPEFHLRAGEPLWSTLQLAPALPPQEQPLRGDYSQCRRYLP